MKVFLPRVTMFGGRQSGAVLMLALIFMLLITLLGVGALQSSTLQERMAGNVRDMNVAFQSAEAAVRAAEDHLQGAALGSFNGTNGLYPLCVAGACTTPEWNDRGSAGWRVRPSTPGSIGGVNKQPEFIIEELPGVADPTGSLAADEPMQPWQFYRITARGYGMSDATMSVIQVMYRRN